MRNYEYWVRLMTFNSKREVSESVVIAKCATRNIAQFMVDRLTAEHMYMAQYNDDRYDEYVIIEMPA